MPTTRLRNLCYRAAYPVLAPSVRGRLTHLAAGDSVDLASYEAFLTRYHVHGASLRLKAGARETTIETSLTGSDHQARPDTLYRVASLTKMATSLLCLHLISEGAFALDSPVADLLHLPSPALQGISVRHLLSHTSSLRDTPCVDQALDRGETLESVLATPGIRVGNPGAFAYCNFGFGILGCVLEAVCEESLRTVFDKRLLFPLALRGTLDASTLDPEQIMPVERLLPYHPGHALRKTRLGSQPLDSPDPTRHFGHTAGALYTDSASILRLLDTIRTGQCPAGNYVAPSLIREMHSVQATYGRRSPTLSYGLGLLFVSDPRLSPHRLVGHQGLAYGCVDGAFYEEDSPDASARQMVFLNGGCSEARIGMMTCSNRDLIAWSLKEMNRWLS